MIPEWIKVEDELPGYQHMVLCYVPLSYNGANGIHYGWLSPKFDYKGEMVGVVWKEHSPFSYAHDMEDERHTGAAGSRVTHWMPLPRRP